eukprot:scaffold12545_cov78-Skeletonema_dohrnii-CCMP3373.AAC.1
MQFLVQILHRDVLKSQKKAYLIHTVRVTYAKRQRVRKFLRVRRKGLSPTHFPFTDCEEGMHSGCMVPARIFFIVSKEE